MAYTPYELDEDPDTKMATTATAGGGIEAEGYPTQPAAGQPVPQSQPIPPPPSGDGPLYNAQADDPNGAGYQGPAPAAPPPMANVAIPDNSAQQKQSDDLFQFLMSKAKQSSQVDANDPMIRAQSDNYAANLTRQGRRYLSELAERKGSGGNIGAESRMMSEKNAQAGAEHEGQLLQHESDGRKAEIQHALSVGAQYMTAQQQMSLQKELATIDNNMKLYQTNLQNDQFGRSMGMQKDQFGRSLNQNESQFGRTYDLQNRTLAQQAADAAAGRAQSGSQFGSSMSARENEFNRNLAQRAYEFDTDDEYRRSPYASR